MRMSEQGKKDFENVDATVDTLGTVEDLMSGSGGFSQPSALGVVGGMFDAFSLGGDIADIQHNGLNTENGMSALENGLGVAGMYNPVLGAASTGLAVGKKIDEATGASDYIAGVENTSGTRGAGKTFGSMSEAELTTAAVFNPGMNDDVRKDVLSRRKDDLVELFGGLF
jgi:hypothetical protein